MTPLPDLSALASFEKKALTGALLARIEALTAHIERLARRVAALEAENALLKAENVALREKLALPPKTPENSSTPPSQRHKANARRRRSRRTSPIAAPIGRCIPIRRGGARCERIAARTAART
jgi:hypothetical protein